MGKTIEDKTIHSLQIQHDIHVTVTIALFLLTLLRVIDLSSLGVTITPITERYVLMITLIAIPVALKLFSDNLNKRPKKSTPESAVKAYKAAYNTRLYIITAVTLANIFLFAVSRNSNFMWLSIVLFIVYFFCRPSHIELMSLTETKDVEKENDETA